MKRKTISAVFFVLFVLNTIPALAQTTKFTLQGKLAVVDGQYEFEFTLFDAQTGGNQLGNTYLQVSPPWS